MLLPRGRAPVAVVSRGMVHLANRIRLLYAALTGILSSTSGLNTSMAEG